MKTKILITSLLILTLNLSLSSCKKNKSQEENLPEYYFKAKFDGTEKIFSPAAGQITHLKNIDGNMLWDILLSNSSNGLEMSASFGFGLQPFTGNGTYNLSSDSNTYSIGYQETNPYKAYISENGTLTIQVFSDKFEGTFSATLKNENTGDTIEVTDGEFVIQREPDQTQIVQIP